MNSESVGHQVVTMKKLLYEKGSGCMTLVVKSYVFHVGVFSNKAAPHIPGCFGIERLTVPIAINKEVSATIPFSATLLRRDSMSGQGLSLFY
jgi:hypothetical protein